MTPATSQRLEWLLEELEADPLKPAPYLVAMIKERCGVGRSRAYELLKAAQALRRHSRRASPDFEEFQENRRQMLLDLLEETQQAFYAAKLEGNRAAQTGLIRQLLAIEAKLAECAPLETFGQALEHRNALSSRATAPVSSAHRAERGGRYRTHKGDP